MFRQRISPPWVWSWIGPRAKRGSRAIPEVLHRGVVDDELAVQVDGRPRADLEDAEAVPLAERLVGQDERVAAGGLGAVVEQAAGALVGPAIPLAPLLGRVPDLHLRRAPEVDAAVGLGDGLVVDQQLDVAVFLVGGQVGALAVVDQLAVLDAPVLLGVLGPLGELLRPLLVAHGGELARVEVGHAVPAVEVLAVEQGGEARRGGLRPRPGPSGRPRRRTEWTEATARKAGMRIFTGVPPGSGFNGGGEPGTGGSIGLGTRGTRSISVGSGRDPTGVEPLTACTWSGAVAESPPRSRSTRGGANADRPAERPRLISRRVGASIGFLDASHRRVGRANDRLPCRRSPLADCDRCEAGNTATKATVKRECKCKSDALGSGKSRNCPPRIAPPRNRGNEPLGRATSGAHAVDWFANSSTSGGVENKLSLSGASLPAVPGPATHEGGLLFLRTTPPRGGSDDEMAPIRDQYRDRWFPSPGRAHSPALRAPSPGGAG